MRLLPIQASQLTSLGSGLGRDKKRLMIGLGMMSLFLGQTVIATFVVGESQSGGLALGIPLVIAMATLTYACSAALLYMTYSSEGDQ